MTGTGTSDIDITEGSRGDNGNSFRTLFTQPAQSHIGLRNQGEAQSGLTFVPGSQLEVSGNSSQSTLASKGEDVIACKLCIRNFVESLSTYSSPTVKLVAGGPESPAREGTPSPYHVHRDLLRACGGFFEVILKMRQQADGTDARWKENETDMIQLPEDRVEDVGMFVRWLYWQNLQRLTRKPQFASILPGLRVTPGGSAYVDMTHKPEPDNDPNQREAFYHPLIDDRLDAYVAWKVSKLQRSRRLDSGQKPHHRGSNDREAGEAAMLDTRESDDRASSNEKEGEETSNISDVLGCCVAERPEPPAFGPLIRLYIFADKYDVGLGLRARLITRIVAVRSEGKAVPAKEDIDALWDSIGAERDDLKQTIVDMFARRTQKEYEALVTRDWHPDFLFDLAAYALRLSRMARGTA